MSSLDIDHLILQTAAQHLRTLLQDAGSRLPAAGDCCGSPEPTLAIDGLGEVLQSVRETAQRTFEQTASLLTGMSDAFATTDRALADRAAG